MHYSSRNGQDRFQCIICGITDKRIKKHFINRHLDTHWWGVFPFHSCWHCNHYESKKHVNECGGSFNKTKHLHRYQQRINDFLEYLRVDLGLDAVEDILTLVKKQNLVHTMEFDEIDIQMLELIDGIRGDSVKAQYSPKYPMQLSEIFHWYTLAMIFQYCNKVGIISSGTSCSSALVPYMDSHCHLDQLFEKTNFVGSVKDQMYSKGLVRDIRFAGCLSNFVDPWRWNGPAFREALIDPNVHLSVGLHPKHCEMFTDELLYQISDMLQMPKVEALGEIGLEKEEDEVKRLQQEIVFIRFLQLAIVRKLTVIIHCRDVYDRILELMKSHLSPYQNIHYHGFLGTLSQASSFLDHFKNGIIGLNGLLVTKETMMDVIAKVPVSKMIIETDSPNVVYDGSTYSSPADCLLVAHEIAVRKGIQTNDVLKASRKNFLKLYHW